MIVWSRTAVSMPSVSVASMSERPPARSRIVLRKPISRSSSPRNALRLNAIRIASWSEVSH